MLRSSTWAAVAVCGFCCAVESLAEPPATPPPLPTAPPLPTVPPNPYIDPEPLPTIPPLPPPPANGPPAATDDAPSASFASADGAMVSTKSRDGSFRAVAVVPAEVVLVQLRYALSYAGQEVIVRALDGGQALPNPTISTTGLSQINGRTYVAADGTCQLKLRVGSQFGLYRFVVRCAANETTLNFIAPDPSDATRDLRLLVRTLPLP